MGFAGFVALGDPFLGAFVTKNSSETPTNVDSSLPIFKVYGPSGLMQGGTGIASKLGDDDGVYQLSVTTDPSNGYESGAKYDVLITAVVNGLTVGYEQSFIVS
jgi:hypothetical protein